MKRKLHKRELSILVRITDLKESGELHVMRHYHLIRETTQGCKIGACAIAQRAIDQGEGYYLIPYFWFLAYHLDAHFCDFCWDEVGDTLTPASNTGVNSKGESAKEGGL